MLAPRRFRVPVGHVLLLRLDADVVRHLHGRHCYGRTRIPSLTNVSVHNEVRTGAVHKLRDENWGRTPPLPPPPHICVFILSLVQMPRTTPTVNLKGSRTSQQLVSLFSSHAV